MKSANPFINAIYAYFNFLADSFLKT
ncbi:hypothetical protein PSAB6_290050 [Paraburkholderia sabiae]|nr:hypothetical protein PSAB6_290050 [Paraburkholderia sabiae]